LFVKKARVTENQLLFVVSALKKMFQDENFLTLLRAERLDGLPAYVAERMQITERA
jgi:ParB family chromosome partitioning protein